MAAQVGAALGEDQARLVGPAVEGEEDGGVVVDATSPRFAFAVASVGGALVILAVAPTLLRAPAPKADIGMIDA